MERKEKERKKGKVCVCSACNSQVMEGGSVSVCVWCEKAQERQLRGRRVRRQVRKVWIQETGGGESLMVSLMSEPPRLDKRCRCHLFHYV